MSIVRCLAALLLLSCVAPRPAGAQAVGSFPVSGRVVDAATGHGVRGAVVRLPDEGITVVSDGAGFFGIPAVPAGARTALVARIGYQAAALTWQVVPVGIEVEVALQPLAVRLEEIAVQDRLFERRRRSSGYPSLGFDRQRLALSSHVTLSDFLAAQAGLREVACGWMAGFAPEAEPGEQPLNGLSGTEPQPGCVLVRGAPVSPCVIVDEARSMRGWEDLALLAPAEVHSVDVVRGGFYIQVYTTDFVRRRLGTRWRPMGLDALIGLRCRF